MSKYLSWTDVANHILLIFAIPDAIIAYWCLWPMRHADLMNGIYCNVDVETASDATLLIMRTVSGYITAFGILMLVCVIGIILSAIYDKVASKPGKYRKVFEDDEEL